MNQKLKNAMLIGAGFFIIIFAVLAIFYVLDIINLETFKENSLKAAGITVIAIVVSIVIIYIAKIGKSNN